MDTNKFQANNKFVLAARNRLEIWTAGSLLLLSVSDLWSYFIDQAWLKVSNKSSEVLCGYEYELQTALSPWHPFTGVPLTLFHESWPVEWILLGFSSAVEMKYIIIKISLDLTKCCLYQPLFVSSLSKENAQQSFNLKAASQGWGNFMYSRAHRNENSRFRTITLMAKYLFYPSPFHLSHGLSIMIIYGYHFGCSEQQCLGLLVFSAQDEKWSLKECSLPSRHVLTALILHLPNCICWLLAHLETSGTKSNWSN